MFTKKRVRIILIVSLAGLYFIGLPLSVRINSGDPAKFSGDESLKRAIWTLAAFMPPMDGRTPQDRFLELEAEKTRPAVQVRMRFKSPQAVWPGRLTIVINPDEPESPDYLRIDDSVPFGRENLTMTRADGRPYPGKYELSKFLVKTLNDLSGRLQSRPRLADFDWREQAPGFHTAHPEILYGARVGRKNLHLVKMDPE